MLFKDITERKRADDALRASEKLNAYLLELSDALRPLSDATEIQATVTRTARQHFAADRCFYCEIEDGSAVVRRDDSRADLRSIAGHYRLDELPTVKEAIEAARPLVIDDVHTGRLDEALRQRCIERQIIATLDVPVIRNGKATGLLCFAQCAPREWTEYEILLASETAERAWGAVERARALDALRSANEQLVEAARHKDDFLAVLSHELRNPLTPIRNSVHILERATAGSEQAIRARHVIDRQAKHLVRLIDDLLDVTRISRGKVVLHLERVDLSAIARATADDHREVFARRGVDLKVVDAGNPLWVDGDATRLVQVIGNLLTNSAKFTPRGGRTVLTIAESGGRAFIRVADTGAGLSRKTRERLFQPFVQAAQTLDRAGGGLGLGLSLVKGLMELHHGTVAVRSEGEGKGSEFEVALPLAAAVASTLPADEGTGPFAKRKRVLVIEDNVDSADSLRELLLLNGHEVSVAYSGLDGLQAARSQNPDLILCDLGLPGLDGYQVARAIRADADAKLRKVLLIALSGYALAEDVSRSKEAGFDRHIAKPPSLEALASVFDETP